MRFSIKPMSTKKVLELSHGEVTVDDTISFRNNKPYNGGLFCEKIFGPINDFICSCGALQGISFKGKVCTTCGVEVNSSKVRKDRFGHISLPIPVLNPLSHNLASKVLGIPKKSLSKVLSGEFDVYIIESDTGNYTLTDNRTIFLYAHDRNAAPKGTLIGTTAGDLHKIASMIDIQKTLNNASANKVLKGELGKMQERGVEVQDFFIEKLLVLPPVYRPIAMVSDMYVSKSYNDLYLRILRVVTRVNSLTDYNSLDTEIYHEEAKILQKAVNNLLIDGSSNKHTGKALASIFESFQSKSGRFRNNLLGKRIDYSGRSVITSAPELSMDQLKIPFDMAYEMFKPFIIDNLCKKYELSYRESLRIWTDRSHIAKIALRDVSKDRVVIMNRQPSLHRYSVMAFYPVLHYGKYIGVPPIVCSPFGADFDGDTCAIHLPLSNAAQEEAKRLLLPSCNMQQSSTGGLLMSLSHESIIGTVYMTRIVKSDKPIIENSYERLENLYESGVIKINTEVLFKKTGVKEFVSTCVGRLRIGKLLKCEVTEELGKKEISRHIYDYVNAHTSKEIEATISELTRLSFHYATVSGMSVCIEDCQVMKEVKEAEFKIANAYEADLYAKVASGELLKGKAEEMITRNWYSVIGNLDDYSIKNFPENPLTIMFKSGARLSKTQFSQILVAKGVYSNARGEVSIHPIEQNYTEGLSVNQYFHSCSAAHKAMADKKLITPVAGYLARQLVSSSRELLIGEHDCKTTDTIDIESKLAIGRYDEDGNLIKSVSSEKYTKVRSPVTCKSHNGICQVCFGTDPSTKKLIKINSRVGLIAAQSVSEPTTQLSMKSKHTSGAATISDKDLVIISSASGTLTIEDVASNDHLIVKVGSDIKYLLPREHLEMLYKEGDSILSGTTIAHYTEEINQADISGTMPILFKLFNNSMPGATALYTTKAGKISLLRKDGKTHILIDNELIGSTSELVMVADGEMVDYGIPLTKGYYDITTFFSRTGDLKKSASIWVNYIYNLYSDEGIKLSTVNLETILRSMTDLVESEVTKDLKIRSRGGVGRVKIFGISQVAKKYPSWLKSLGFGFAKSRFMEAVSNLETTINCETEQIMYGALTPQVE